jgi:hypothetical protein
MAYIVNKIKSIELAKYNESGYHYFISKNGEVAKECIYSSGDDYYTEINFEKNKQVAISDSVKAQFDECKAAICKDVSLAKLSLDNYHLVELGGSRQLAWCRKGVKGKEPVYSVIFLYSGEYFWYFYDTVCGFLNGLWLESYCSKAMAENSNIEYFSKNKDTLPLIDCAKKVGDNYLAAELKWLLGLATKEDAEYLTSHDNLARFVAEEGVYDSNRITVKRAKLCHHGTQISGIKRYYSLSCIIDGKPYMAEWREKQPEKLAVLSYNRSTNIAISQDVVEQIKSKLQ